MSKPSIEFISFDKDNKPQKKVIEGDPIADLLLDDQEIGKIIQELRGDNE